MLYVGKRVFWVLFEVKSRQENRKKKCVRVILAGEIHQEKDFRIDEDC